MYLSVNFWVCSSSSLISSSETSSFASFLNASLASRRMLRMATFAPSAFFLYLFYQLFTTVLGKLREYQTDDSSVIGRVDAKVRHHDRFFDLFYQGCFPRLDLDHTCFRNRDVCHLLQRSRCSIVIYSNAVQYMRVCTACADGSEFGIELAMDLPIFTSNGFTLSSI